MTRSWARNEGELLDLVEEEPVIALTMRMILMEVAVQQLQIRLVHHWRQLRILRFEKYRELQMRMIQNWKAVVLSTRKVCGKKRFDTEKIDGGRTASANWWVVSRCDSIVYSRRKQTLRNLDEVCDMRRGH